MPWTRKSYDALYDWLDKSKRPAIRAILQADNLQDIVSRLDAAPTMGEWYKITHEAAAAVGPSVVAVSAQQAEIELNKAAAALGKKGGKVKSDKKTIAVRKNGRLGGRPKKDKTTE